MAKTQILDYFIYLTDKDRVESLNAQLDVGAGGGVGAVLYNPQTGKYGISRAPYNPVGPGGAAVEFSEDGSPLPLVRGGLTFETPCVQSAWFGQGYQTDVATFTRSSGIWPFGSSTKFYWSGHFVYAPKPDSTPPDIGDDLVNEAAKMPSRIFLDGFEQALVGEGAAATSAFKPARAASRVLNGYGFAFRRNTASTSYKEHDHTGTRKETWERFYIRVTRRGAAACEIYQAKYAGTNPGGLYLYVLPNGTLAVYASNGGTIQLLGLVSYGALTLGTWYRIDVIVKYVGGTPNVGQLRVWVNQVYAGAFSFAPGGGSGSCYHSASMVGRSQTGDQDTIELDYDDWIGATPPDDKKEVGVTVWNATATYVIGDIVSRGVWLATDPVTGEPLDTPPSLLGLPQNFIAKTAVSANVDPLAPAYSGTWHRLTDSPDFLTGAHVQPIRGTAFGTGHGAWGGAVLQQFWNRLENATGTDAATSTVALDPAVLNMDVATLKALPGVIGMGAINVVIHGNKGTNAGTLGVSVDGAAFQTGAASPAELTSAQPGAWLYAPAASTEIPALPTTLVAEYIKGNDAVIARLRELSLYVEVLGTFGGEDILAATEDTPRPPAVVGYHNARYPFTPWATAQQNAIGPVVIKSGTYVGNGTATELTFPAPVHWLSIRATTANQSPSIAFPAMNGMGHPGPGGQSTGYPFIARLDTDPAYVAADPTTDQPVSCRLTIIGTDARWNANTVTYEYVAIMDPAHRFALGGAMSHAGNLNPVTHTLDEDPDYLPEVGFFQKEDVNVTTTAMLWWKGVGHAAAGAQILGSATAEAASAITFARGQIVLDSGFNVATEYDQQSFVLFRRADGNNDPGQASLWTYGSYVGDGSASRTISLAPSSGKRPLLAIVQAATAVGAYMRDPLFTGSNSCLMSNGSVVTTAITAGAIDSFTVGSTLNTNGVTFNYFVIFGSATAGNNGWSGDGTFTPVGSDSPTPTNWAEPTVVTEAPPEDEGGGEGAAPDEPDLATACLPATTKLVNQALTEIGVSRRIVDLVNENSQAASDARLHIKDDIDEVLRRFAWPFAKRYATLVLVAGTTDTPVNPDWQYSYRAPADMIEPRRITSQTGTKRQFDPNPIAFERGQDATGDLIFTDAEAVNSGVPVVLEYTARVTCPVSQGDALFREAVKWKHAASLAPSLAKDANKGQYCDAKFRDVLETAKVRWGNEQEPQKPDDGDAEWIRGR